MTTAVHLADVRRLMDEGAQGVEVLPRREYEEEHLPGAISLPLKEIDATSVATLARQQPVIVYCWDGL
jgi:rhodanese-related sulfurtransferase